MYSPMMWSSAKLTCKDRKELKITETYESGNPLTSWLEHLRIKNATYTYSTIKLYLLTTEYPIHRNMWLLSITCNW